MTDCQYFEQYIFSACKYYGFVWNISHVPPEYAPRTPLGSSGPLVQSRWSRGTEYGEKHGLINHVDGMRRRL